MTSPRANPTRMLPVAEDWATAAIAQQLVGQLPSIERIETELMDVSDAAGVDTP
jgi:hypothetical protein